MKRKQLILSYAAVFLFLANIPAFANQTVLVANFLNGNNAASNSRVYLWNPSQSAGDVTARVFTLPLSGGLAQELTDTPLNLGTLGARSALNVKLAEDILTPLGITLPYTDDDGDLTLEFTIQAAGVRGAAQVFSSSLSFGTYPLQEIPSTSGTSPTVLVANFVNGNDATLNSRVYLFNPSAAAGKVTVRVFTLPLSGGLAQELTDTPLNLGTLGARSALNVKLAEDSLTPLGIATPYTIDGGNLTLEFTIQAADVVGAAQVFSSDFAFGVYPLQEIPATSSASSTVFVANFLNGNNDAFNSRVYLWNPSTSTGDVTVRVFTLPLSGGLAQELTGTLPLSLGTLGARSALNVKLAEDVLTPMGIATPYTIDGGNLTLEFTIQAADVVGAAQVFSSSFAFGTNPLQEIPSTSSGSPTVLVANFVNGNDTAFSSRVYLFNPSQNPGEATVRVFTLPLSGGVVQELTATPLSLGTLGARSALNLKVAEDILTPLGITTPYTDDGGNLTLEFTIDAPNVRGAAQVFSPDFAFGTYPLQEADFPAATISKIVDGIVIVEDDGTLLTRDRPLPITSFSSIRLVPNSNNSFDVTVVPFSYHSDQGQLVVERFQGEDWVEVPLNFDFPLGGRVYRSARVSRRGCVIFSSEARPPITFFNEMETEKQYELFDALADPTPRLCPLFTAPIHSTPHRFTSAYARSDRDRAVFTWEGSGFDPTAFAPVDFQLVLHQSGEVIFRYKSLEGIQYGAVMAVTGQEPWWSSEKLVAESSNALDATSNRLKSAQFLQRGDTNAVVARFQAPGPLPNTSSTKKVFGVEFFEDTTFQRYRGRLSAQLDSSGWKTIIDLPQRQYPLESEAAQVQGDTVSIVASLEDFVSSPEDTFAIRFYADNPRTNITVNETINLKPIRDIRADFTAPILSNSSEPLLNVYTLPSVSVRALREHLVRDFGSDWDHAFVYPTFDHGDGGYSCCGSAGVTGIGDRPNLSQPPTPDVTINSILPLDLASYNMCNYLQHGFGHRWLYFITIMEDGVRTHSLNPDLIHPSLYVHAPAAFPLSSPNDWSHMGGLPWRDNGDGTFTSLSQGASNCGYSWVDLYLMGLASSAEVPDWFYIRNPEPLPVTNKFRGTKVPVNIQQVIVANGPRIPDFQNSQKDFLVPFVLLHRRGKTIQAEQLSRIQSLRTIFKPTFEKGVDNRARMQNTFHPPVNSSGPVTTFEVYSGDGQSGLLGKRLWDPLVVTARNSESLPVAGTTVNWSIFLGSGTLSASKSVTDENGHASVFLTPGFSTQVNVRAHVTGNVPPAQFTAFVSNLATSEPSFLIDTVAGNGSQGFGGDGSAGTSAQLNFPRGVAEDSSGNIYIADSGNHRIRRITLAGVISTIGGTGTPGFSGDGGPATSAQLNDPYGIALDDLGNLYIADRLNDRVRKITPTGVISTVADSLRGPTDVAVDASGSLYVADQGNHRVRRVTKTGSVSTVAGTGKAGFSGDGGSATLAQLNTPTGVAVDGDGHVYIADGRNNRIRKVTPVGVISTVAGTGTAGFNGDGILASSAQLNNPWDLTFDEGGNLYIADWANLRIRKITPAGVISTVAGNGSQGFSGDGGFALAAKINFSFALAVDRNQNLYIADTDNHRIRKLTLASLGIPATVTILSGNNQFGEIGSPLANPLVVEVRDQQGYKISREIVTFAATNASVNPVMAWTDSAGRASTTVTLGNAAGRVTVTASVSGVSPATFSATVGSQSQRFRSLQTDSSRIILAIDQFFQ